MGLYPEELWPNRWLVMEGDWGGQIYLTIPIALVGENAMPVELLRELDRAAWGCNQSEGAGAYVAVVHDHEEGYPGGMGGGALTDTLWLHEEFTESDQAERWRQRAIRLLDIKLPREK